MELEINNSFFKPCILGIDSTSRTTYQAAGMNRLLSFLETCVFPLVSVLDLHELKKPKKMNILM